MSSLTCKCVFYRPEHNTKGDHMKLSFEGLKCKNEIYQRIELKEQMISHISHSLGKIFKSSERSYWVLAENGMVNRLWWFCSVISIRHKKCDIFDILMTIIPGENMITRQRNPFSHLLFQFYSLLYFIFVFQDLQNFVSSSLLRKS